VTPFPPVLERLVRLQPVHFYWKAAEHPEKAFGTSRSFGLVAQVRRWDAPEAHYRAIFDDKGRMMMLVCHNTDLGDGWEREGEDEWYFREFSEKKSYPLGINILFYMLTH